MLTKQITGSSFFGRLFVKPAFDYREQRRHAEAGEHAQAHPEPRIEPQRMRVLTPQELARYRLDTGVRRQVNLP